MSKAVTKAKPKAEATTKAKAKVTRKPDDTLNTGLGPKHSLEYAEFIADILAPMGPVTMERMFSGQGFRLDGIHFAMLLRGTLFLRVDEALATEMDLAGAKPFRYSTSVRTVTVDSYRGVPEEMLDEPDQVVEWAKRAVIVARLNPPKKKKKKADSKR